MSQTTEEIRRMAERLLILADSEDAEPGPRRSTAPIPLDDDYLVRLARSLRNAALLRREFLCADLFGEPAWLMLLDLFVEKSRGRPVPVTALCIASAGPDTTALRWIGVLEEYGLIMRKPDERDRRRSFMMLTYQGESALRKYLTEVSKFLRVLGAPALSLVTAKA